MKNILIVDDENAQAHLLKVYVEEMGYRAVDVVPDGQQAILSVITRHPDLILMDVNIAGSLDGIETMERIRKFSPVPVIYTTANMNPKIMQRAARTERSRFMHKPLEFELLRENINHLLNPL